MSERLLRNIFIFGTLFFFVVLCSTTANPHLNRLVGIDFMTVRTQYVSFWMLLVWVFGLVLFLPGVSLYVWDFFGLSAAGEPRAVTIATAE